MDISKNVLLIIYENKKFRNQEIKVGGVLTACQRILNSHKKLYLNVFTYKYNSSFPSSKFFMPFRLIIDNFLMIYNTFNKQYSYIVADTSSFLRTVLYLILSKIVFNKCFFYVDIRGGGSSVRLLKGVVNFNTLYLWFIYYLSDKIILQTPNFENIPFKFRDKVFFLPNTLRKSHKNFLKLKPEISETKKFGFKSKLRIIYSGRITEAKGIPLMLDLMDSKISDLLEINFLGSISLNNKNIKRFFSYRDQGLIKYYGCTNNEEELLEKISNHDLFLFISSHKTEGMPNSIMDAIALQIPVLTSNCGFISDMFNDSHLTFLEKLDVNTITSKILNLIENYNYYNLKAENAYKHAMQNYTDEIYEKYLKKLYFKESS